MTMKTTNALTYPAQQRRSRSSTKKSPTKGVRKSSAEKRERQQILEKLRRMVGVDENSSQLEIVQHVIDYIYQLRDELCFEPVSSSTDTKSTVPCKQTDNAENVSPDASTSNLLQQLNRQLSNMLKS